MILADLALATVFSAITAANADRLIQSCTVQLIGFEFVIGQLDGTRNRPIFETCRRLSRPTA